MANSVKILSDLVANQIAAGEVVERPASIVKELLENSIDAGASEISVTITNGGRSSIEIIDDGCGMSKEDALVAIERFGTSKISAAEDLNSISTLGFRGEALPSIAAVSEFTLSSSTANSSNEGVYLEIVGGNLQDVRQVSAPKGTKISVKNLFFNVPARRRFLRSEKTETSFIKNLIGDFASAYPQLRFRLVADGTVLLNIASAANFERRVEELKLAGKGPIVVQEHKVSSVGDLKIHAVLSQPENCIATSAKLRTIVNGRVVRDKVLLAAVRDGYGNFLKGGQYPIGVLKLDIPAGEVDVNVHPQKSEVRFRNSQAVFSLIAGAIRSNFNVQPVARHLKEASYVDFQSHRNSNAVAEFSTYTSSTAKVVELFPNANASASLSNLTSISSNTSQTSSATTGPSLSSMRYVGQVFDCYLLFEGQEQVAIVDMHAAHERIRFAELSEQFSSKAVVAQTLLCSEVIEIEPEHLENIVSVKEQLSLMGIEFEQFGENAISVSALPAVLGATSAKGIFDDIFSLASSNGIETLVNDYTERVISRLACHGSIRSGQKLEREEAYSLVKRIEEVERGAFCPHGRPVVISLTHSELEVMFGRK